MACELSPHHLYSYLCRQHSMEHIYGSVCGVNGRERALIPPLCLQGGFELKVTVEDWDRGRKSEVVDVLVVSRPSGVRPSSRFTSAREVRGNAGRGFLRFNYRLTCTSNSTGDRCTTDRPCGTTQCTDSEWHTQRWISIVSLCSHLTAMAADTCSDRPCQNDGVCTTAPEKEAGYTCSCPPPFVGSLCELESDTPTTTIPLPAPSASECPHSNWPLL